MRVLFEMLPWVFLFCFLSFIGGCDVLMFGSLVVDY